MGTLEDMAAEIQADFDKSEQRKGFLPKLKEIIQEYSDNRIMYNRTWMYLQNGHTVDDPTYLAQYESFQHLFIDFEAFVDQYPSAPLMIKRLISANEAVGFSQKILEAWPTILDIRTEDELLVTGREEYKVAVDGGANKGVAIQYELHEKGIDKVLSKMVNQGFQEERLILWAWDSFQITDVVREFVGDEPTYYFNYVFNKDLYTGKTIEQMRDAMAPTACRAIGVAKVIFGPLIQEYVKKYIPVIKDYHGICGFTTDGWVLPDKYYIRFLPGLQSKIKTELTKMARMTVHEHEAREMMQTLYKVVCIKHKDIIFAWGMAAPFFHALVQYTNIMPVLSLGSTIGNTGKTPAAELVTTLWWNNLPHASISSDQFNTEARAQQYLSASTFGVCVDECAGLRDNLTQLLKSHMTGTIDYTRLRQDSSIAFDRPLLSPLILTWNTRPVLMDDFNFLLRTLHVPVDDTPTKADVEAYSKARAAIPRGYFGKYIYHMTEEWDADYVIQRVEGTPWLEGVNGRPRTRWIGRLLQFGAELFKELFGVELNLSHVPGLLADTIAMHTGSEETLIMFQIVDGRDDKMVMVWDPSSKMNIQEPRFQPQRKWITTPVRRVATPRTNGYIYTNDNLNDLRRRANRTDLSMETAAEGVARIYPHAVYKSVRLDGKSGKHIYIPYEDVFPQGEDFNENDGPVDAYPPAVEPEKFEVQPEREYFVGGDVQGTAADMLNVIDELYEANMRRAVDLDSIKGRAAFEKIDERTVVVVVNELMKREFITMDDKGYMPKRQKKRVGEVVDDGM